MTQVGVGIGQEFTTRPELRGSFGMVSSTHWLASAAGMRMLELGGNAFDAAAAAGFVLQVVQPHYNGPGGDLPIMLWDARVGRVEVICGQGVAPAAATPQRFRELGVGAIPGTGLLAACVPGALDGWLLMLRDRGLLPLREVLSPAIHYARSGYTVTADLARTIDGVQDLLRTEWLTTGALYLPDAAVPTPGTTFRNPALAATYERILESAERLGADRQNQIQAARDVFYQGFVAEAIDEYLSSVSAMDSTGERHSGLLSGADMCNWSATWEDPVSYNFRGTTVCKLGPWSQGPVFLQQLAILDHTGIGDLDRSGAEYVHTLVEAAKLAYADREAWYTDPNFGDVPIDTLLSSSYGDQRRALIGATASLEQRPGSPDGRVPRYVCDDQPVGVSLAGMGEPTVPGASAPRPSPGPHDGDTCHVDVVDHFGNFVSATPSGGWLQSSPTIPALGFALGTRMQMFDLDDGTPNQVAPGRRPRTTLSPSLALRDGLPWLAFGTPGGDQQDQWALQFFLSVAAYGDNLQLAIDRPAFNTTHLRSSFAPRRFIPGRVYLEERFPIQTLAELDRRGHEVLLAGPWALSRVCAVGRAEDAVLLGAANARGMEAYAVGR